MSYIKLSNVEKKFGRGEGVVPALQGVDFTVEEHEMVAIMGASGSGKSTLLNILGGMMQMNCLVDSSNELRLHEH